MISILIYNMADITMSLDDTLELDTIIKESTEAISPITVEKGGSHNLNGIQTHTGIFDPVDSGDYILDINGQKLTIEVTDPNTNFLIEEDGDISEWSGDISRYSADSTTNSENSSYSIGGRTDGGRNEIQKSFPTGTSDFKISVRQGPNDRGDNASNNEVIWRDNGTDIYGLYLKLYESGSGLYWSKSGERTGGELIDGSLATKTFHTVKFTNIDTTNETIDISVNGDSKGTFNWHNSGSTPNQIVLSTNTGGSQSSNYFFVDNGRLL